MSDLISRSELKKVFGYTDEWYKGRTICAHIDNAPTVEAYPFEQVQELVKLNQQFAQEIENLKKSQADLADEVWKLYEKHHSHLATYVLEFGYELKDLLSKYQKGGRE